MRIKRPSAPRTISDKSERSNISNPPKITPEPFDDDPHDTNQDTIQKLDITPKPTTDGTND